MSQVQLEDSSGRIVFTGQFVGGVGGNLRWLGIWSNTTAYVPGDVVITPQGGGLFLSFCVAPNTNVNPFTDTSGTAKLGTHWYVEY